MEKPAVTYETLFETLRREKSKEELQKLSPEFFEDIKKYLAEKKQSTLSQNDNIFSEVEKEKFERQLANIKKLIRDLYERREKKIISMALNKSRVNAVIDTSTLLVGERAFFDSVLTVLNNARIDILDKIFTEGAAAAPAPNASKYESAQAQKKEESTGKTKLVRFLCSVPQFVGPDLEIYGPFEEDDVATLAEEVCVVLVSKNRAEEIEAEN